MFFLASVHCASLSYHFLHSHSTSWLQSLIYFLILCCGYQLHLRPLTTNVFYTVTCHDIFAVTGFFSSLFLNLLMARLAGRNRPKAKLTHVQRVVASHAAQTKRLELKEAVNGILEMVNQEVSRLSLEHKKSHRYFLEQIHQGGRFARGKRGVNVFNAAQHAIGLVENKSKQEGMSSSPLKICNRHLTPYEALDISQEACETIKKVVHKVQQLGGPEKAKLLNEADRELLTQRLEETRHHLNTAAHARPIGVLHDTRSIMQSMRKRSGLYHVLSGILYSFFSTSYFISMPAQWQRPSCFP